MSATAGEQFIFNETLQLLPELACLEFALNVARQFSLKCGFTAQAAGNIELVVEEILVNIISYGKLEHDQKISLHLSFANEELEIVIKDPGIAFNMLTNPKNFTPGERLELIKKGGLGIFLVINLMDSVRYKRVEGINILSLIKHRA